MSRLVPTIACLIAAATGPLATAGSAYLFDITTGEHIGTLKPDNPADSLSFGATVAISATRAVVGTLDQPEAPNPGNAFLFDLETGKQVAGLRLPTTPGKSSYPSSIAIDSSLVAVSAALSPRAELSAGATYLYNATTGSFEGSLHPQNPIGPSRFGTSVSVGGNLVIVGDLADSTAGTNGGALYVFDSATGSQLSKIAPDSTIDAEFFGLSTAISESLIAVGAPLAQSNSRVRSGALYLFDLSNLADRRRILPLDGRGGDSFGASVSLTNEYLVVGAPLWDDESSPNAGAVYIYDPETGTQLGKLTEEIPAAERFFGASVGISENMLAVSAPANAGNELGKGVVYLYDLQNFELVQKFDSPHSHGQTFGFDIAISGNRLIVGQPLPEASTSVLLCLATIWIFLLRKRPA